MKESYIIGSGARRARKGSYKTVYRDNRGRNKKGEVVYAFRAEIQTMGPSGVFRTRRWFKTRELAHAWLNGKACEND